MLRTMKWTALLVCLALGCGGKKEETKAEEEKKESLSDRFSGITSKAKELGSEAADKAKDLGSEAKDLAGKAKDMGEGAATKAKEVGNDVEARARTLEIEKHASDLGDEVARRAENLSKEALSLGKDLKAKMLASSKLAKYNYDFSVDAAAESEDDYQKKFGKMKMLQVENYKVGFERRSQHPLGKVYKWQFMVGWRLPDGRTARLSLFTDDELEELLLASMMGEIVPAANLILK